MAENKSIWDGFTNLYSLSKTLRFELKPVGKTLEHIEKKGLLAQDEKRAEDYKLVKKIIDRFHKGFIERALGDLKFTKKDLGEFKKLYSIREKTEAEKIAFDGKNEKGGIKEKLRAQIASQFLKTEGWSRLFSKELIKEDLLGIAESDAEKELINEFKIFTTYFTGFHENRKNMYSSEEHGTAIAYRLIHENLPKFLDNLNIFASKIVKSAELQKNFSKIEKSILNEQKITDVFSLDFFNTTLTQTGIDLYNTVLGGFSTEDGTKVQGLNEYINLYNQKQADKKNRIPKLKPLYKQILSDRDSSSFLIEAFQKDNELLETIEKFYQSITCEIEREGAKIRILKNLKDLTQNLTDYELDRIFLRNDTSLTDISQSIFGDWGVIKKALEYYYMTCVQAAPTKITKKYEAEKERYLKQSHFSIQEIESAIVHYKDQTDEMKAKTKELNLNGNSKPVCDYFKNFVLLENKTLEKRETKTDFLKNIEEKYKAVKDLLNTPYPADKRLLQDKNSVTQIKALLDAVKAVLYFFKPLHPQNVEGEKDENFYGTFTVLYDLLSPITRLYDKTRNYMTQRPYSIEKYKLNFENSTLLNGWDVNKESDNTSVLMRKDDLYYLAIMDKEHNRIFKSMPMAKKGEMVFEKIDYKLLPGANKMLPKVFFSEKGKPIFRPSDNLLKKYEQETHKKGEKFSLKDCHALIDFFKKSIAIHEDWQHFDFKFSDTASYEDLSGFYREVEAQGYAIKFRSVPENWINQLIEEGKLFVFQIYNKDFSAFSKGKPNLHTLYWRMLFDKRNLADVVYKLNGEAEVFYRKKSVNYDGETLKKGHHAAELKGKFSYPIISNRRFAFDKFQFHVPITMNFKAKGAGENINGKVMQLLKNNKNVHIIGIDRGERHLLYLTLIDQQGNIKKQMTLNEIVNSYAKDGKSIEVKTDYHDKLNQKEDERAKARESWGVIETIKELKEGYLSHVIHVIARMMIENNAIVVMEDLNFGFKRGRFKVEKQVYQKFEKMLIDKLNYLVFKDKKADEPGGTLRAFQLANKFESFKKLGKQSGLIFYVPAALTSKIDPATGFVDFLKPKYESVEKAREFISKFEKIQYNSSKDWFEFTFDYKKFIPDFENGKSDWTVCSTNVARYRWNPKLNQGKGAQEEVIVTPLLKKLLTSAEIAFEQGEDIVEIMASQDSPEFFKELIRLLSVLLALRHNNGKHGNDERDYILSAVEPFFNSQEAIKTQPNDADANGAFHIALKGLWALEQISESSDLKKVKLAISNKEWLQFAQSRARQM